MLVNPTNPNAEPDTHDAQAAAGALGLELRVFTAGTEDELESAFAAMARLRVGGLLVNVDGSSLAGADESPRWLPTMQFLPFTSGDSFQSLVGS